MNIKKLKIKIDDRDKDDTQIPFKYDISSYGADIDVKGLVGRIKNKDIYTPKFQRDYVWSKKDASQFIESLLLGLPVPGIFLSKDRETNQSIIIDGQQRLMSLYYFFIGHFIKEKIEFCLIDVQEKFVGKTYKTLTPAERRKLDDSLLHVTFIEQVSPSEDQSSIYYIFERLNTHGKKLSDQEIRACIFQGPLMNLVEELNLNKEWRSLFGREHKRYRDQEMILRFFSLYFNYKKYEKPMKGFINKYSGENRYLAKQSAEELKRIFNQTISVIYSNLGNSAFSTNKIFIAAIFDAVMVGVAKRIFMKKEKKLNKSVLIDSYNKLFKNKEFQNSISEHTSDKDKVVSRIDIAINLFKGA